MEKLLKLSTLLLVSSLILIGCGSAKIYNVQQHKVDPKKSSKTVYKAIKSGGQSLGWKVHKIKPGVAQAKLLLRTHVAVVRINYNNSGYNIQYVSSKNLKYDAEKQTIHSNYNGWIQYLENAIDVRL